MIQLFNSKREKGQIQPFSKICGLPAVLLLDTYVCVGYVCGRGHMCVQSEREKVLQQKLVQDQRRRQAAFVARSSALAGTCMHVCVCVCACVCVCVCMCLCMCCIGLALAGMCVILIHIIPFLY